MVELERLFDQRYYTAPGVLNNLLPVVRDALAYVLPAVRELWVCFVLCAEGVCAVGSRMRELRVCFFCRLRRLGVMCVSSWCVWCRCDSVCCRWVGVVSVSDETCALYGGCAQCQLCGVGTIGEGVCAIALCEGVQVRGSWVRWACRPVSMLSMPVSIHTPGQPGV